MAFLLDTHVVIAMANGDEGALSRPVRAALAVRSRPFFVSVASIWEIAIKFRLGKLKLGRAPEEIPEFLGEGGIELMPITILQALAEVEPRIETRDPFDNLLLAICAVEGMTLVTADSALKDHPLVFR